MKPRSNPFLRLSVFASATALLVSSAFAENLTFNGNGTVNILASDWDTYLGGSSTFNAGANDGGRLYWRGSGDGQYIHFNLNRLSGLTMNSTASVTLQNTNATYGGGVDGSFIATANGAWTAGSGATIPGATAISDATNATGSYGSGTSISWGIGASTFQSYVNNASSFNGLAIIGGSGSQMHFDGPINPYLTVTTNAAMNGVVTVSGGAAWNSNNYSFTNGVLTLNDAVVGDNFGAGNVTINSLGTVFVNGDTNKYWAVDSTRINTGGVLLGYGHSHLRNLTLAGGELAGIRPNGTYGTWMFDDATTVTGGVTSTISAQDIWLNNGNFTIEDGATLNFSGSVKSGTITPTIGAGARLVYGGVAGSATTLGAVTLNGGELAATSTPSSVLGNFVLSDTVTVGGTSMSTISADVRVINNQNRTFNVANADGGSGVDLLVSGKLGHYNGVSGGSFTKTGAGTMKISGTTEVFSGTVNEGKLILENAAIPGWWGGGLVNNASVDFNVSDSRSVSYNISGSGSLTKTGVGQLTITGSNLASGGITIDGGTLVAGQSAQDNGVHTLGTGNITINNGGTLRSTAQWSTSSEWNGTSVGTITINQGGSWQIQAVGQTIRNGLVMNGGSIDATTSNDDWGALHFKSGITAGGGVTSTINADTALSGSQTFTVNEGSQLNYSGRIHNQYGTNSGITKTGAGTLVLSAANIHTGGTSVTGGTLRLENTSALGSGTLGLFNGTSLQLRSNSSTTFNGGDGLGGLGDATINLDVNQLSSGNTNRTISFANGGFDTSNTTINVTGGNGYALSLGGINQGYNGSLTLNAVSANLTIGNIGSVSAVSSLGVGGSANTTITGGINTAAGITKTGTGTLTLSGSSNFSGVTNISAGTIIAASNTALGQGGHDGNTMSFIQDGATLALQGGVSLSEHFHVWGSGVGGLGAVRSLSGNNALTNAPSGGPGFALRSNTTVGVDADTLTMSGFYEAEGSFGITKVGAGKLVLTVTNTYTGGTTVNGGTLELIGGGSGNSQIGGPITVNQGGTLSYSDDGTGFGWNDRITSLAINGGTVTSAGTIHVWNISGGITMTGGTLQSNGGVSNANGAQLEWNRTSVTTNASADTATIGGRIRMRNDGGSNGISFNVADGAATTDLLISAAITEAAGGMGITKSGSGTLTLSGTNTYTGSTTISAGKLVVNGSLSSSSVIVNGSLGGSGNLTGAALSGSGSINPGNSPGILTVSTVNPSGGLDFNFEFGSANVAPSWDQPTASVNDVLRLTGGTPFNSVMSASNIVSIFLNVGSLTVNDTFTGGFFTDLNTDFSNVLNSATFQFFLADNQGATSYGGNQYSLYNGSFTFDVTTVEQTANFGSGDVTGRSMQFTVVPETSVSLLGGLSALLLLRRKRQS